MGTRAETQAATRARLLDAAEQLFADNRATDVSIDDVARAAGFTKGAVYANFSSKADLMLSTVERRMHDRGADYIDVLAAASVEALSKGTGARAGQTQDRQLGYFRLVAAVWAEAVHDEELAARFVVIRRAHRDRLATAIRRRASDAEIELQLDVDALAAGLVAMSMASMLEALIDPEFDVAKVHATMVETVQAGSLSTATHIVDADETAG